MVFQKRLPNKIPFGCFATSDNINYWNVKATGVIFYFLVRTGKFIYSVVNHNNLLNQHHLKNKTLKWPQTRHVSSLRISGRRGRYYCIFSWSSLCRGTPFNFLQRGQKNEIHCPHYHIISSTSLRCVFVTRVCGTLG